MNLKDLGTFDVTELMTDATGRALDLPTDKIDSDPENPRKRIDPETVTELAASIQRHGLVQPIIVRPHPAHTARYMVVAGERRLRAVQQLGLSTIHAYIRTDFNAYLPVVENVQRDDIPLLDLLQFVKAREADGDTRTTIAQQLGKAKSFVTELASLAAAPPIILDALRENRIPDTRTAYLLSNAYPTQPQVVADLLASGTPLTRERCRHALAASTTTKSIAEEKLRTARRARERPPVQYTELKVTVHGKVGRMTMHPVTRPSFGRVTFDDGKTKEVELRTITLVKWI